MGSLFFTLGNLLQLMVIRDLEAHLDGQSILTETFSIFGDMALRDPRQGKSKENTLHLERIDDPEYYGFITFQKPGELFTYTADGKKRLSEDKVAQLIDQIAN